MLECLAPSWWNYLGRIRMCDLRGSVSLVVGFEVSKDHSQSFSASCLQIAMSLLCHRAIYPSETVSSKWNVFFSKLPWSWWFVYLFITAVEKYPRQTLTPYIFYHWIFIRETKTLSGSRNWNVLYIKLSQRIELAPLCQENLNALKYFASMGQQVHSLRRKNNEN